MEQTSKQQSRESTQASLTIKGLPHDLQTSPEKIRKVLEILELPEGIKVEIVFQASSIIVR